MTARRFRLRLSPLLALFLVLCACGPQRKPNLVLISVDTLRPDHLGMNGCPHPDSPNIDQLALQGRVFTRAYSQAGWTLPSMASILTGRFPKDHQAVDFHFSLRRDLPTLASILKEFGYDTRADVSHVLLTSTYGLDRGFTHYDASVLDRGDPHKISTSKELAELALKDLAAARRPFFLWVHFFDPHFAYLPHAEWTSFGDSAPDRYDQEIAFTDGYIGRILRYLDEKKLARNTVVVLVADHGEEFGEHGGIFHETCYDEVLRIPLIIRAPGLAANVDTSLVEQIDILPTILSRLGVPLPPDLPGRNLLAGPGTPHPLYIERDRPPGTRQRAVIFDGMKLVHVEPRDTTLIPAESRAESVEVKNVFVGDYLYDLRRDPGELKNLYRPGDPMGEKLMALLAGHFRGVDMPPENVIVDQEMRERLRSLGYIQ